MQTDKDFRRAGFSGSDATDAERKMLVCGIQEAGRVAASTTETLEGGTHQHELFGGGGGQCDVIQGFAAKPWVPAEYQERGVTWLASRLAGALFLPPGMGKTSISLAAKEKLSSTGFESRMLVLAPLTVCLTTWLSEPQKWRQFQGLKVGLAHGPDKELILNDPYYDIVLLNYANTKI